MPNPARGEKRAADVIGDCKPRSKIPSLTRPGIPVAPE